MTEWENDVQIYALLEQKIDLDKNNQKSEALPQNARSFAEDSSTENLNELIKSFVKSPDYKELIGKIKKKKAMPLKSKLSSISEDENESFESSNGESLPNHPLQNRKNQKAAENKISQQ